MVEVKSKMANGGSDVRNISELARQKAIQAWCKPETSNITIDPRLTKVFAEILDEYIEALIWCGGSVDFAPEGKAYKGWVKICTPLVST